MSDNTRKLADRLFGNNEEPLPLVFIQRETGYHLKPQGERDGTHWALIRAARDNNLAAVKKHLSLGASPDERSSMKCQINPKRTPKESHTWKNWEPEYGKLCLNALEVAARVGASADLIALLAKASFSKNPHSPYPMEALKGLDNAFTEHASDYTMFQTIRYDFWGVMTEQRFTASAIALLSATPIEFGAPWLKLAAEPAGREALSFAIKRLALLPPDSRARLANEALLACCAHGLREQATGCLSLLGSKANMAGAQLEAAAARQDDMAAELELSPHAYAIAAGELEWISQELKSNDLSWTNRAAPLRPRWGPLAAALEKAHQDNSPSGLPELLIKAGAPLDSLTASDAASHPVPLLAQRVMAGDGSGARLLLLAGASPTSLNESVALRSGGKGTALGAAALSGDIELTRFLISSGADPRAIPNAQLSAIANANQEMRSLLGNESAFAAFSRSTTAWAKSLRRENPKELPAALIAAGIERPSSLQLDVSVALSLGQAALLPEPLSQRLSTLSEKARELSPNGALPATDADAPQLRRLWENNLPLFLKRLAQIPPQDRALSAEGSGPSPLDLLESTLASADAAMSVMRQRALQGANTRLLSEAAVICSNAGQTVEAFQKLIERAEERTSSPQSTAPIAPKAG